MDNGLPSEYSQHRTWSAYDKCVGIGVATGRALLSAKRRAMARAFPGGEFHQYRLQTQTELQTLEQFAAINGTGSQYKLLSRWVVAKFTQDSFLTSEAKIISWRLCLHGLS